MANEHDGSLIFDSQLDNSGFEKGSEKLLNAIKDLTNAVDMMGENMMRSFGKVIPLLETVANAAGSASNTVTTTATHTADANEKIADSEQRVSQTIENVADAIEEQDNAANGFSNSVRTTQSSVSALERDVNSLTSGLQSVSKSVETGFANGKAVLAFDDKIQTLEQKFVQAREQLEEFGSTNIPTDSYKELAFLINRTEQALFRLLDKREDLEALGVKEDSKQWERLVLQISNAEDRLARYERERDILAANGKAFVSGADTAEYARMDSALKTAGENLERNKALIDQEAIAQAKLNVLVAQEAVAAATTAEERKAAASCLQAAQEALRNTVSAMSNHNGTGENEPTAEKIGLWARLGSAIKTTGAVGLQTASNLAKIPFQALKIGVQSLAKHMGVLAKNFIKLPFQAVRKGFQKISSGVKNFIQNSKSAKITSNALVKSLTSLKRMLISRIKEKFISEIFNSAKESLKVLAKFSDSYNSAMSDIKNSSKELSSNIAVSLGGVITSFEPLITAFLDKISTAVTYINALFAVLNGKSTMTVAKKQTESYRDSLDDAAESAEELKNQIYGFDELNKRSNNDDNSSKTTDGTDLYEEVPIDSVIPESLKNLFDELKQLWDDGNFFDFGKKLAELFNSGLQTLDDWFNNVLRPKGTEWAKNIAELLNGLVDGVDWTLLGKTVADGMNAVFDIINTFLTTFDFENLGVGIGKAINGWFANIEWDLIGQTFANGFNSVVDIIHGIVTTVDWATMGDSIAEFVTSFFYTIDWDKAAETITVSINGITTAFQHFIDGVDWDDAGKTLGNFGNSLVSGIDWKNVGNAIGSGLQSIVDSIHSFITEFDWETLGESLSSGFMGIWDAIDWNEAFQVVVDAFVALEELILGAIHGIRWADAAKDLATGINNIDISELLTNAAKLVSDLLTGVFDFAIEFIETVDWSELTQKLWDGLMGMLNSIDWSGLVSQMFELLGAAIGAIASVAVTLGKNIWNILKEAWESTKTYFSEYIDSFGGDIIAGLWAGIKNAFVNVGTWIKENIFDPFINGFKKAFGINSPSTVMAEQGNFIVEGLLQGITGVWGSITSFFFESVEGIKSTLSNAWDAVKEKAGTAWENIKTTVSEKFTNAKDTISDIAGNVKTKLSDTWENTKSTAGTAWENIKSSVSKTFEGLKENLSKNADNTSSSLSKTWNSVKTTASTAWNNIKSNVSKTFEETKSALSKTADNTKSALAKTWDNVKSNAGTAWSNIKSATTKSFEETKSSLSNTANNIKSTISNAWKNINTSTTQSWATLKSTVTNLWNGLKSTLSNTSWSDVGTNLVSGLQRGIQSAWSAITSTVSSLANSVTSTLKSVFSIHSPSKVWAEIGEYLDMGLSQGLKDKENTVLSTVANLAKSVNGEISKGDATLRIGAEGDGIVSRLSSISDKLAEIVGAFRAVNSSLMGMDGFHIPVIASGSEVPYKTRISSDTTDSQMLEMSSDLDEVLSDHTYLLRRILELLEKTKLGIDNDELARAIAFALRGVMRGYGGV